jgi:hypothetical protein
MLIRFLLRSFDLCSPEVMSESSTCFPPHHQTILVLAEVPASFFLVCSGGRGMSDSWFDWFACEHVVRDRFTVHPSRGGVRSTSRMS